MKMTTYKCPNCGSDKGIALIEMTGNKYKWCPACFHEWDKSTELSRRNDNLTLADLQAQITGLTRRFENHLHLTKIEGVEYPSDKAFGGEK